MKDIMEYSLCKDDIFYFIEKYFNIEFRPYYAGILKKFLSLKNYCTENILGHRGSGLTTLGCVYALWKCIFYPKSEIAFFSAGHIDSVNLKSTLLSYCRPFLDKFGIDLVIREKYIKLSNDSYIHFTSELSQTRGRNFNTIIFENIYTRDDGYEIYEALAPISNIILLNTCLTHEEHKLEKVGKISTYPWYYNPNLNLNWYIQMLNSLDKSYFDRMYGCTRGNSNDRL